MTIKKLPLYLLIITVLIITACTKKDNLTGNNWSNLRPATAIDSTFTMGYSYTHAGKVTGSEQHLLCGVDNTVSAIAVMRFINIPDPETITLIGEPVLKLVASRRSPLGRNPLVLSFYKLNQNWAADSTADILDVNITPLSIAEVTVQDTISSGGDTLTVNIPVSVIENWKTSGIEGFNLVIKALNGGWLELKSNEIANGPLLNFKYKLNSATDTLTYNLRATKDSHRISGEQSNISTNVWKLKNTFPQRMFFKFGLPDSIFRDADNQPLDAVDIKRMTINKAELILYVKNNPYYSSTKCFFYPYRVKTDTLVNPMVFTDSNLEAITRTVSTGTIVSQDYVKINITAIIQAYTSGDKENNGIVIRSLQEMQNYGNLEFWHFNDANIPAGKKPRIAITYSAPYLPGK